MLGEKERALGFVGNRRLDEREKRRTKEMRRKRKLGRGC